MGLGDRLSAGFGSLGSSMNPRNTAADLAVIEHNLNEKQKTSQYYMTNIGQEQMRADKTILQHQTKMQEDSSYIPENFSSREEFNQFLKEHADSKGITGRTSLKTLHRLYGDEKFWESMNAMGLTSAILGRGKWVDSENTKLQTIVDEDGNETVGFQPKVRTADAGRGQIYSADMTKGGANVRDIYAEGGDDALADSRTAISLDDLDKVFDRYYTDTYIAGGGAPNAEMLAQTLPFFPETSEERANLEQQIQDTVLAKDAADYNVTAAEATLDTQQRGVDRAAAATEALGGQPTGQQAAITAATDDKPLTPMKPGEGIMVGDRLAETADEMAMMLPALKNNPTGLITKGGPGVQKQNLLGYRQTTVHPFGATDEQWAKFSQDEKRQYTELSKKITARTNQEDLDVARKTLADMAGYKIGGTANNEAWSKAIEKTTAGMRGLQDEAYEQVKGFYADHPVHEGSGDRISNEWATLFRTRPELLEEFQKDPVRFAMVHDPKELFGNKPTLKDSQAANGNMNGAKANKVITAAGIGTGDIDLAALNEQADKLGKMSDKQQEELVALQNKEKNNFLQYSEKARANLALKYYASLKQDSEEHANAFANGSLALFVETGSWDLAGEQFQLNVQEYELKKQKHNFELSKLTNEYISMEGISDFTKARFTELNSLFTGNDVVYTSEGLNQFHTITGPMTVSINDRIANAATPGERAQALSELNMVAEVTMKMLGNYINTIHQPRMWEELITFGFASGPGATAFDSSTNIVPVDQYQNATDDPTKVVGYLQMNPTGTVVGVDGTDWRLSNTTLGKELGQNGLDMLFTIGLSNLQRIQAQKGGTP